MPSSRLQIGSPERDNLRPYSDYVGHETTSHSLGSDRVLNPVQTFALPCPTCALAYNHSRVLQIAKRDRNGFKRPRAGILDIGRCSNTCSMLVIASALKS